MAFKRVRRARLQADWREIFKPGWGLWGKWGGRAMAAVRAGGRSAREA